MATVQGRTFEQLRVAVGRILGVVDIGTATGGSTTTLVDTSLRGGDNAKNGKWYQLTSGTDDGVRRQASDYVQSTNTVTVIPAWGTGPSNGVTYEEWDERMPPEDVEAFIQQAVIDATGHIFDPTDSITTGDWLHTGSGNRFDIPTTFEMLNKVEVRTSMVSKQVIGTGIVWDESVDTDCAVTQETEDLLFGRTCTKFVWGAGVSNGDLVSHAISSLDLSNQTHIEFPIKVRTAVVASDLVLRLSATASGADTDKIIAVPALSAGAETWVRVAMTEAVSSFDPSEATAIISVALEYNANSGVNTIYLGEIRATQNDSYGWTVIPSHLWDIDKEARDLVFKPGADTAYYLMKLSGGDNPAIPTVDADVIEVPESYIIWRAAGVALLSRGGGPGTDPDANRQRVFDYLRVAENAKRAFPMLVNARNTT